ncbi:MAG: cupin protein [Firmicutes bacterium]|nr:cupin protein [Bacillota bacterium]
MVYNRNRDPWQINMPMYDHDDMCPNYNMCHCPYCEYIYSTCNQFPCHYPPACPPIKLKDCGPKPFAVNIEKATKQNDNFRIALWTGKYLQLTLMSINVGEDIGLESHPNLDQFIRIEKGQGLVKMGDRKDRLNFQANVRDGYAFIIPAGKWHNLINTGDIPIKLYSIYAPPQHPHSTVHITKEDAEDNHRGYYRRDY